MKELINIIGGPTILIFIGAILAAVGAVWASMDQNNYNDKLNKKNEEIARLSQRIVDSVTGGETVCYFAPLADNPSMVTLVSEGGFPLYDLSARVTDLDEFDKIKPGSLTYDDLQKNNDCYDLDELPPKSARFMGPILKFYGKSRRWNIFFSARNGFFTQELRMKKINDDWTSAIRVTRHIGAKSEIAFEKVSDNYPRNPDGSINW